MSRGERFPGSNSRNSVFAILFIPCLLAAAAFGQGPAKRFPVTEEMIASAMQHRQLPVEGARIRLSAPITSSVNNPMLNIENMQRSDPYSAQLRIACRNRTECLSFYVSVNWPAGSSVGAPGVKTDSTQGMAESSVETSAKAFLKDDAVKGPARDEQATLRAGAPATLLIEEGRIHITVRVVSLGSGVAGDKIRVATPDRRSTYQAEVLSPTLLKGTLLQ